MLTEAASRRPIAVKRADWEQASRAVMKYWWRSLRNFAALCAAAIVCAAAAPAEQTPPPKPDPAAYAGDVCSLLGDSAAKSAVPVNFLTRLIWRESFFNANAVSPAGAEGIAQFMPGTAKLRGLADSFDYRAALPAAAAYLAELKTRFGNFGIAAAAYNAGEDAAAKWVAGRRYLPLETEDYVLEITGHAAGEWKTATADLAMPGIGGAGDFASDCPKLVMRQMLPPTPEIHQAPRKPWGVVVAGGFSVSRTLFTFQRVKARYAAILKDELPMVVRKRNLSRGRRLLSYVMVGRNSRAEAEALCRRLLGIGGGCSVLRN